VLGEATPETVEGKQITTVITACHVILAVSVVLVCHFVVSRTKEVNAVTRQTVRRHALDRRGDISDARYSILVLNYQIFAIPTLHTLLNKNQPCPTNRLRKMAANIGESLGGLNVVWERET
jgi:hypothetical protein